MSLRVNFINGRLTDVDVHSIEDITLTDCRESERPFVSINFLGKEGQKVHAFVSLAHAGLLSGKLAALFEGEESP